MVVLRLEAFQHEPFDSVALALCFVLDHNGASVHLVVLVAAKCK